MHSLGSQKVIFQQYSIVVMIKQLTFLKFPNIPTTLPKVVKKGHQLVYIIVSVPSAQTEAGVQFQARCCKPGSVCPLLAQVFECICCLL